VQVLRLDATSCATRVPAAKEAKHSPENVIRANVRLGLKNQNSYPLNGLVKAGRIRVVDVICSNRGCRLGGVMSKEGFKHRKSGSEPITLRNLNGPCR
jgi:hypothetical protein